MQGFPDSCPRKLTAKKFKRPAKLIRPDITPEHLLKETTKAHPKASKSELARAAFASMIALADRDPDTALMLQSFALAERRTPEIKD